jgi:hypothetical protein
MNLSPNHSGGQNDAGMTSNMTLLRRNYERFD